MAKGVFKWGHVFQRGDLPIYVTDLTGNPLGPYSITYSMYYHDNGTRVRVGPSGRIPVQADVGEYYVTGVAGQCGQPGDWCVEWVIQEYSDSPLVSETYCYKVFNTAEYCSPSGGGSGSCGCKSKCGCAKFGWG